MSKQIAKIVRDTERRVRRIETMSRYNSLADAVMAPLSLPGLRSYWPMSSVGYTSADQVRDIAGYSRHLTNSNGTNLGREGIIPIAVFNGTNQWLYRADGGAGNWADITGTESFIISAQQGLTIGGWFKFDDAPPPASAEILMGKKSAAAGNYSYWLQRGSATGNIYFYVSNDGTATTSANSGTTLGEQDEWHFIVGRFNNTDNQLKLWVNAETFTETFNNTIFSGNANVTIGAVAGGGNYFDGRASLCFLCAAAATDAHIGALYEQTHPLFV